MRRPALALALALALLGPAAAQQHPRTLPSPWTRGVIGCGGSTGEPSHVCDPAGALTQYERDAVDLILDDVEAIAKVQCSPDRNLGIQLGVVLPDARDLQVRDAAGAVEAAKAHLDAWGVGQAGCDNGAVLVVALEERKFGMYAGGGARDYLNAPAMRAIEGRLKAALRAGAVGDAVKGVAVDVGDVVQTGEIGGKAIPFGAGSGDASSGETANPYAWLVLAGVFVGVAAIGWAIQKKNAADAATNMAVYRSLDRIDRVEAEALRAEAENRAAAFDETDCPICLEPLAEMPLEDRAEVRLLGCGHRVCKPCAEGWFGAGNLRLVGGVAVAQRAEPHCTCPICRADARPAGPDGAPPPPAPPPPQAGGYGAAGGGGGDRDRDRDDRSDRYWQREVRRERLRRLRTRYPSHVTEPMVRAWMSPDAAKAATGSAAAGGGGGNFRSSYTATRVKAQAARAKSSQKSRTRKTGGGSSRRGGGSGGSW